MKRTQPLLILSFLLLVLAGCSRSASPPPPSGAVSAPAAGGEAAAATAAGPVSADRSLVVTMDVGMTVTNIDDTSAKIRAAVEGAGGFVADSQLSGNPDDENRSAHLELRVPANKTSNIRARLTELGTVTRASEKIEDVTEQRADLEARLHNARVQEKRVLEIMAGKASTVGELVEAEKELARIRENIERLEAQERVMKGKIQLATVRVSLTSKSAAAWDNPGPAFAKAGKTGITSAKAIAVYSGMAFLAAAPTVLPIAALFLAVAAIVRRKRRGANYASSQAPT